MIQAPTIPYEELVKEHAIALEANRYLQGRVAELERDNNFLRTKHVHQVHEIDWHDQAGRVDSSTISASQKATARGLRALLREKKPNADGFSYVEAWEITRFEGLSEGTHLSNIQYLSDEYVDGELTKAAKLPLFEKRLVTIIEPGRRGRPQFRVFLKANELLEQPNYWRDAVTIPRNHGGADRNQGRPKKCECGGDIIEHDKPLVRQKVGECNKCHKIEWAEEPRQVQEAYLPTDPDPEEGLKNQVDFNSDSTEEEDNFNQLDAVPLSKTSPQVDCKSEELSPLEDPITPPIVALEEWLTRRIGTVPHKLIQATGKMTSSDKYISLPEDYVPDIGAYLRGELEHIYGSNLRNTDGTTWVLEFDYDTVEQSLLKFDILLQLANAGAAAICWPRRPGRGHLGMYFDAPVNAQAAYQWAITVCPLLADFQECYPVKGIIEDKRNQRLSWPLWYRDGNQVIECAAIAMLPGTHKPIHCPGIKSDPEGLRAIVAQAVTPAALIPERIVTQEVDEATAARGGVLLDTPRTKYPSCTGDGLGKVVIADFNDRHTWKDITGVESGYFLASWRGERTASVLINDDGETAHDFGNTGAFPNHFDKFDAWCLIHRLDKREELKRRIAEKRVQA